jgi:beta-1,4-mannooligosaccharide/beta-1,4-mannosyl-N-acetylglucosamine phosphorylase
LSADWNSFKTSPAIQRFEGNPVLTSEDVPFDSDLVFNAGIAKYEGRYVMVFRNDYGWDEQNRFEGTNLGLAFSDDGISWDVQPSPCFDLRDEEIRRGYDPRLTVIGDRCVMCFAIDTEHGVRGGVAVTEDFDHFDILSMSVPDNRNMVLFPERIGGKFVRLERPFPVYSRGGIDRFDLWLSDSPDLVYWGNSELVLGVEDVPFANDKVGPGAPPIRTDRGWLTTFHAVIRDPQRGVNGWEPHPWQKVYFAGVMLLDLEKPSRIVGMSRDPLIAPEAPYETKGGFRNDVIFPTGMLLEEGGEVRIYYGAADTTMCLATADLGDLLDLCQPV